MCSCDAINEREGEVVWKGHADCSGCAFRSEVLFKVLREEDFPRIHLPIDEFEYEAGSRIYSVDEKGMTLFTVRSGLIKLVKYMPDGRRRIVRLLRRGNIAGLEVMAGNPYEHTAVALKKTRVCRIPHEVIRKLSEETPRLYGEIIKYWSQSVQQADAWLTEFSTGDSRRRVASLLLFLAEDEIGCDLPSREDMGSMLGITTETASRTIAGFKREGILVRGTTFKFNCDIEKLREIVEKG